MLLKKLSEVLLDWIVLNYIISLKMALSFIFIDFQVQIEEK